MRIISGSTKGKRLQPPTNLPVRPTTDFAKEGLFNIIDNQFDISNLSVLDLFSGTGNIAYEFASRGAKNITTVDQHKNCINFIRKTNEALHFNIACIQSEVFRYLEKTNDSFDIIFADPPYDFKHLEQIHKIVFERNLLRTEGCLIIEHSSKRMLNELTNFAVQRKYGNVNFSFFYA